MNHPSSKEPENEVRFRELLKEREHFFRSIIENSSDILVVLDPDRTIRYVSPAIETILGHCADSVIGTSGLELVDPEDYTVFAAMTAAIFERGEAGATGIIRARSKSGELRHFDVRAQNLLDDPLFRGVVVDARDITESKRIESALRTSEARFRKIIETSGEGIGIRDTAGALVFVNRRFAEMLGYQLEEMIGRNVFDLVAPEFRQAMSESGERRKFSGASEQLDLEFMHKDGSRISVILNASPLFDAHGNYQGALGMLTDITQRKQLEAQLLQSQKIEAVGRLAGGIAHDFNNLLTAIRGHVELLLSEASHDSAFYGDIDEIRKAADRAAALTQQLLAFSRRQILQPRVIEIDRIVGDMNTLLRRLIGEDIQLETDLKAAHTCVRADPGQIEQVLLNLAVNARDAMPQGGVLVIATRVADIDDDFVQANPGARAGRHVELAVGDSGVGMDEETLSHLFEPFFTTKELGKGTGLGLATVYGIIKQSDGYIRVVSEADQGTRFEIFLPVVHESPSPLREPAPRRVTGMGKGETVLVCEDEEAVRALACRVLRTRGYNVLEAGDGVHALAVAHQHGREIHLLLTDVVMPLMGGRELAEKLCTERPRLKVLYMSGYTDDALIQRGISQGRDSFIEKPFTPYSLTLKVREVLEAAQ